MSPTLACLPVRLGTDAKFSVRIDGVGYDEDGVRDRTVPSPSGAVAKDVSTRVRDLTLTTPAGAPLVAEPYTKRIARSIQFWTPDGHNAWVGDVAVGTYKGRFHVFYLLGRRHHSSKGGSGGHYFAHISSADLVNWDDHGTAIANDAWWMTQGTGTPFVRDGKFHLAYGLHTSRLTSEACSAAYWQDFKTNGTVRTFKFGELPGYPAGATYASSEDGIHFTPSEMLIHPAENPTVYTRTDGRLGLVGSCGVAWDQRGLRLLDRMEAFPLRHARGTQAPGGPFGGGAREDAALRRKLRRGPGAHARCARVARPARQTVVYKGSPKR